MKIRIVPIKVVRWVARITGTALVILIIYFSIRAFGGVLRNRNIHVISLLKIIDPFLTFYFLFLGISLLSLFMALWKEGPGGFLSLISLLLMSVSGLFVPEINRPEMLVWVSLLAIPSFLYVFYWWRVRRPLNPSR